MPSTRYLSILAMHDSFPIGLDESQRVMFSCNFECTAAAPLAAFEAEIAKLISDAGLGTLGTDLFVGPLATMPTGSGPYTEIFATGGFRPDETHDGGMYEHPAFQLTTRASSYLVAEIRSKAIRAALHGIRNTTITT